MSGMSITLSADALEAIAARAAELAYERLQGEAGASPWMTRRQAAAYLGVPVSRLEKDRTVPCRRWDGRVLYHRGELDTWLDNFRDCAA
jgi:hypothetical protein